MQILKQEVKQYQWEQKVQNQEVKNQEIKNQEVKEIKSRSPNQEVLGQQSQDISWRINIWDNHIVILIAFNLPTNKTYLLT